jgi:SAM-dependent methyltransferase
VARRLRARVGKALEDRLQLLAPARRLRFQLTTDAIERFAADRPIRVLDAGCGDGLLSESLARQHPTWRIVGADARAEMLERGRARVARAGVASVEFVQADLTNDLGHGLYDVVAAVECLVEIPDDARALMMMAEALRPGGLFVAQVPERDWKPVLPWSDPTWRDEVRHGYRRSEFAEQLRVAGLTVIEVRRTYRAVVGLAQEVRDRIKNAPVWLRGLAFPLMALAVRIEQSGVTWGRNRALFAIAIRSPEERAGAATGLDQTSGAVAIPDPAASISVPVRE